MESTIITACVIALVAVYPGWLMLHKAYYTTLRWRFVTPLIGLLMIPVIAAGCFYLPFWLNQGKQMSEQDIFIDFVMFGICPAGIIALIAYVLDHIGLEDKPRVVAVAGAALLTIALLPAVYYFYGEQVMSSYEIVLEEAVAQ